jgi:hypothetical protein
MQKPDGCARGFLHFHSKFVPVGECLGTSITVAITESVMARYIYFALKALSFHKPIKIFGHMKKSGFFVSVVHFHRYFPHPFTQHSNRSNKICHYRDNRNGISQHSLSIHDKYKRFKAKNLK